MIQRPASGTFDLEFGVLTHSGKKSFAISTSAIFQHLHKPLISASLRPALARVRGSWLACRFVLRSGGFRRCYRTTWSRPLFFRYNAKAPNDVGAFWFLMGIKNPACGPGLVEAVKPHMEWGTAPAAMQLHQMADTTVATGLNNIPAMFVISVIFLPSSANEKTVAVSISGVTASTAVKTASTNSNAIWVAGRAAGFEPSAPRSH